MVTPPRGVGFVTTGFDPGNAFFGFLQTSVPAPGVGVGLLVGNHIVDASSLVLHTHPRGGGVWCKLSAY